VHVDAPHAGGHPKSKPNLEARVVLLLAVGVIVAALMIIWLLRRRPGSRSLVEPPHTPPTVPWRDRGR
jgi:hypothetical protein